MKREQFNPILILGELKKFLRPIAVCMRGYGYSSYNRSIKNIKDLADDIILFITLINFTTF